MTEARFCWSLFLLEESLASSYSVNWTEVCLCFANREDS